MIASFLREVTRGLRSWRRTPGSLLLVILALGLSGGAFITLVSLVNGLFWRELPVTHPVELVGVSGVDDSPLEWQSPSIPVNLFDAIERTQTVFQSFAGFDRFQSPAVVNKATQQLTIEGVSGRYFETLGVSAAFGQVIGTRDVEGMAPVATISFRCWQNRFGSDPSVIGQTIRLRGELVTIIGVAPREFTGLEIGMPADAWLPASFVTRVRNEPRGLSFFTAFGRLRPGVTLAQAVSQLESSWPSSIETSAAVSPPEMRKYLLSLRPRIESASRGYSASGYRFFFQRPLMLLVLLSAITVVLACANLSGLLLARWSTRETDLAVHAALGASNGRLVSHVVGESMALAMMAVVLSVPLALWSARSLTLLVWNQSDVSSPLDLTPDYRVLGVMAGLAALAAFCVSLLPAVRIGFAKLNLIGGTRGMPARNVTRWGRWLVTAQVAMSVPLLVTTWIIAANLQRLEGVNTGFRPDRVIVAGLTSQGSTAPIASPLEYFARLSSTVRAVPGVEAAALSWNEPVSFSDDRRRRLVSGDAGSPGAKSFVVAASPDYFRTLDVPLIAGRDFAWTDSGGRTEVAIISAELGSALFPGTNPVGRRIRLDGQPARSLEVIGVASDARLAEPHAANHLLLFTALLQEPARSLELQSPVLLMQSSLPPREAEVSVRRAILALGRHDILDVHPLQRTLDAALLRERVMRVGAFFFAGLTTLLVFVGLYSVLNLSVIRRIPEIGLRLALGASAYDVRMTVMREVFVTAATGLAIGIPCALVSDGLIATVTSLVGPRDPLAYCAAIILILGLCALSVLIPLRTASRVTPVEALSRQ